MPALDLSGTGILAPAADPANADAVAAAAASTTVPPVSTGPTISAATAASSPAAPAAPAPAPGTVTMSQDQFQQLMARFDLLQRQVAASAPAVQAMPAGSTVEDTRPLFVQLQDKAGLSQTWGEIVDRLEARARGVLAAAGSDEWKAAELDLVGAVHAVVRAIMTVAPADHNPHA